MPLAKSHKVDAPRQQTYIRNWRPQGRVQGINLRSPAMKGHYVFGLRSLLASLALAALASSSVAQGQEASFELPENPAAWINSRPITSAGLKGKGAVLWFYEEQCPKCRSIWPDMVAVSRKFEGRPVVFIGVNSGNARGAVERYVREVGVSWPVIVDPNRELEKAFGVGEISLTNIHQIGIITPDGRFARGGLADLAPAAERATKGAKWTVDPEGLPAAMTPAWNAIEFGDFATAAPLVKRALASNKPEIKEGATKLNEAVQGLINAQLDEARQAAASGTKWQAYKAYDGLGQRFAGYTIPVEVDTQKKELSADEQVKKELAAMKGLELIKRSLSSTGANARRNAVTRLKKLVQDSADTDAAKEAQTLLAEFGG